MRRAEDRGVAGRAHQSTTTLRDPEPLDSVARRAHGHSSGTPAEPRGSVRVGLPEVSSPPARSARMTRDVFACCSRRTTQTQSEAGNVQTDPLSPIKPEEAADGQIGITTRPYPGLDPFRNRRTESSASISNGLDQILSKCKMGMGGFAEDKLVLRE